MASIISHPFVALALAPWFLRFGIGMRLATVGAACTVLPDLDVLGFHLGVPYDSLLGHRGLSHSLFFAAALAAVISLACRAAFKPARPGTIFAFLFLCTASHGVLDALTDGGLGIALLSPLSNHRYFFPWQPIAVSPLSVTAFVSGRGSAVLYSELLWVVLPSLMISALGWLSTRRRAKRGYCK